MRRGVAYRVWSALAVILAEAAVAGGAVLVALLVAVVVSTVV